jgi:hypothetical protein
VRILLRDIHEKLDNGIRLAYPPAVKEEKEKLGAKKSSQRRGLKN